MGRADLASTLGMSRAGSTASEPNQFSALVSRNSPAQRPNRPNIVR
jgi:hypothetical protein